MFCMHCQSLLLSLSVAMHFTDLLAFSCPSASRANLGPGSAFTKAALRNLGKEGSPSSPDLCIPAQHWPPGLFCAFLEDSGCLAQEIAQICPWASSPSQLELRIAQSQQPTAQLDCAFRRSNSQSSLPDSPDYLLHSSGSQSLSLPVKFVQSCSSVSQVCVVSFPGFALFSLTYFLPCMLLVSRSFRCSSVSMASKRTGSQDTDGIAAGAAVEQVSSSLPIYEDTKLYLDKDIKLKWQEVNETFTGTFGEDLEDRQVYVNIHKSGLYRIACRYPAFPCGHDSLDRLSH
jgi:hypothetical protein